MAIPDTYTFCMSDVCTELYLGGGTTPTPTLSCALSLAPEVSYCSAYSGATSCLRNFRGYQLQTAYSYLRNYALYCLTHDDVNDYMWAGYSQNVACMARISNAGSITEYAVTCGSGALVFDGVDDVWSVSQYYKRGSKINTTTGTESCIFTGLAGCPISIIHDGTDFWTSNFCLSDSNARCWFSKITPTGTVSNISCNCLNHLTCMAFDGSDLWVGSRNTCEIYKINPSTCALTLVATLTGICPSGLVFDGTYIWGHGYLSSNMFRITSGGSVTCFADPGLSNDSGRKMIATNHPTKGCYVWLQGNNGQNTLNKIVPSTGCYWTTTNPNSINGNTALGYNCNTNFVWSALSACCMYKAGAY